MNDPVSMTVQALEQKRRLLLGRSSIGNSTVLQTEPPLTFTIIDKSSTSDDGTSSILFKNGCTYEGQMRGGVMHGQGKYVWSDGIVYEGEFRDGIITGMGTYTWSDGSCYQGEVLSGLRHGEGTYQCADCVVSYTGNWYLGKRQGKGRIVYNASGASYYDGEWLDNKQHGWGKRQYSSGNTYEGYWVDGIRHGHGCMQWCDRGEQYTGNWEHGEQHGEGEHVWIIERTDSSQYPLSNRYSGQWVRGKRHGQGTFHYASGSQYSGGWQLDQKHGHGRFVLPNGRVIEGEFRNDKMVGNNSFTEGTISPVLRPGTPLGNIVGDIDGGHTEGSHTQQFNLSVSPLLSSSLDQAHELQQLHCAILRYLTPLRKAYHIYSHLDLPLNEGDQCNTIHQSLLTRMQLWQLLRDCELHTISLSVAEADDAISTAVGLLDGLQDGVLPNTTLLMREFLQCMVYIAHRAFTNKQQDSSTESGFTSRCLDQLMKNHFLPNACRIKGKYYQSPGHTATAREYVPLSLSIYTGMMTQGMVKETRPTLRQFLLLLKDCSMFNEGLTADYVVEKMVLLVPMGRGDGYNNMDVPIVFLEFLDCLLACADQWYSLHQAVPPQQTIPSIQTTLTNDTITTAATLTSEPPPPAEKLGSVKSELLPLGSTDTIESSRTLSKGDPTSTTSVPPLHKSTDELASKEETDEHMDEEEEQQVEQEERAMTATPSAASNMTQKCIPVEPSAESSKLTEMELWGKALQSFFTNLMSRYNKL